MTRLSKQAKNILFRILFQNIVLRLSIDKDCINQSYHLKKEKNLTRRLESVCK